MHHKAVAQVSRVPRSTLSEVEGLSEVFRW